jgi:hypothetical protein
VMAETCRSRIKGVWPTQASIPLDGLLFIAHDNGTRQNTKTTAVGTTLMITPLAANIRYRANECHCLAVRQCDSNSVVHSGPQETPEKLTLPDVKYSIQLIEKPQPGAELLDRPGEEAPRGHRIRCSSRVDSPEGLEHELWPAFAAP